jgi:hypothetical protein
MSGSNGNTSSKGDIWIAVGVVFCLALGASMTYFLSASPAPARPKVVTGVQGDLINAPLTPATGAVADQKTAAPASNAPATTGDFLNVTFDSLSSFHYEIPNLDPNAPKPPELKTVGGDKNPPTVKDQIPAPIRAFNGKKVAVQGFMVPMKIEKGATKTFLLVKDQSLCCYGRMPRMNEWISVKMSGEKSAKFISDQPVTVFGKLDVGEEIEKGEVLSVYRLEAEDVAGPLDL